MAVQPEGEEDRPSFASSVERAQPQCLPHGEWVRHVKHDAGKAPRLVVSVVAMSLLGFPP